MQIILITGKKRAGKDTLGTALRKEFLALGYGPAQIMKTSYAQFLKEVLEELTGDPYTNETWLDEHKTVPFEVPIDVDALLLPRWDEFFDLPTPGPLGLVAPTPRRLMQLVGTEYVRRQDSAYWTRHLVHTIVLAAEVMPSVVIVSDLRFLSEHEDTLRFMRPTGARVDVVRVRRFPEDPGQADSHSSETEVDRIEADVELGLPDNSVELLRGFAKALVLHRYRT